MEVLHVRARDRKAVLYPTVDSYVHQGQINCYLKFKKHHYPSQVRYTGVAENGAGWFVCSRCGFKQQIFIVRCSA